MDDKTLLQKAEKILSETWDKKVTYPSIGGGGGRKLVKPFFDHHPSRVAE